MLNASVPPAQSRDGIMVIRGKSLDKRSLPLSAESTSVSVNWGGKEH